MDSNGDSALHCLEVIERADRNGHEKWLTCTRAGGANDEHANEKVQTGYIIDTVQGASQTLRFERDADPSSRVSASLLAEFCLNELDNAAGRFLEAIQIEKANVTRHRLNLQGADDLGIVQCTRDIDLTPARPIIRRAQQRRLGVARTTKGDAFGDDPGTPRVML